MGNGCEVSGKSLSASPESHLKWIRVMSSAVVLLLVAGVMLGTGSRRSGICVGDDSERPGAVRIGHEARETNGLASTNGWSAGPNGRL